MVYGAALLPACRAPAQEPEPKTRNEPGAVLPRGLWAKEPMDPARADLMNGVGRITIHHEGSPRPRTLTGLDETAELLDSIRKYHVHGLGWADLGYHYVIDRAGRVWEGRPITFQGAHVRDHNAHNIGVMVLGNFEIQRPSEKQVERLARFTRELRTRHGIAIEEVKSHREWAATACPGRHLQPQFAAMRANGAI